MLGNIVETSKVVDFFPSNSNALKIMEPVEGKSILASRCGRPQPSFGQLSGRIGILVKSPPFFVEHD